jgi:hypothetical protein
MDRDHPKRPGGSSGPQSPQAVAAFLLPRPLPRSSKTPDFRPIQRVQAITGIAGCCARAASGHAAAPPSSVMKSRRFN